MSPSTRRVVVHIERLVLDGLPLRPVEGVLVRSALESELARLLAEGGLAHQFSVGGATPALPNAELADPAAHQPSALGVQVAQALYGALGSTGDRR